jgi:hypothetical protein
MRAGSAIRDAAPSRSYARDEMPIGLHTTISSNATSCKDGDLTARLDVGEIRVEQETVVEVDNV